MLGQQAKAQADYRHTTIDLADRAGMAALFAATYPERTAALVMIGSCGKRSDILDRSPDFRRLRGPADYSIVRAPNSSAIVERAVP